MPSTALPAVLAYRQGALIGNLVHFVDELASGMAINVASVETILSKYSPLSNRSNLFRENILPLEDPESDESI